MTCFLCTETQVNFCRHCSQEFCASHQSKLNNKLCCNCVSDANLETQSEPLIDSDGVTHQGRHIRLIGEGWPNDIVTIASLNDNELEEQIRGLQALLKIAIQTSDYARISIAARQFEKGEREHSKRRKLMQRREELAKGVVRLASQKPATAKPKDDTAKLAEQLGITREQATALMKLASQIGGPQ